MTLGNGWYNPLPMMMWNFLNLREHLTVGRPRGIAQLEIEYADGTQQSIVSDSSWKTAAGPVLRNNLYLGEVYDARFEQPGWDRPGFDQSRWTAVGLASEPIGTLRCEMQPPIRITGVLKPVARTEPKPGVFLFDMGQNFAGWERLRVHGPAGSTVKLRFGELLHPDGTLNVMTGVAGQIKKGTENHDGEPPLLAYQGDTYILSGKGEEVYTPQFTWHGFRYVEVTGYPGEPPLDAVEGLRLSADVRESGHFACSNDPFNRIENMIRWTFLSNLFGVQSDCPHRERFGYGGDIVVSCDAMMFHFDMATFYTKVLQDFADAIRSNGGATETAPFNGIDSEGLGAGSGPIEFQLVFPVLQEKLYQYYGDLRPIRDNYPAACRQLELLRRSATDGIIARGLSDHESLDPKPTALTSTAFYYQDAVLVARFAELLGKPDDARRYRQLADDIRKAFLAKFFDAKTARFDLGTQACQAFALHFGLEPRNRRDDVLKVLAEEVQRHNGHLATGIFGTRYLLETLSRFDRPDLAYEIVNQKTFPGWGHMLDRGATTLWEHWEYSDNVYSHNHPMFGSVGAWFFEYLGGIRPDPAEPGFRRFVIAPKVTGDMSSAAARYRSMCGPIAADWRGRDNRLTLNVTVPPGATATVFVPAKNGDSVTESGRLAAKSDGVKFLRAESGAAVYEVSSGRYQFVSDMP
jgi:alpha-L-rhamnosidase